MQGASYLTLEAKRILEREGVEFPKWIYSSWGSDIYFFGSQAEHVDRIGSVLIESDYLITDCLRDINLAQEHGFNGKVLGVFPTGGGFDVEHHQRSIEEPVSSRRIVALKGIMRTEKVGRATVALEAIRECADALTGHRVVVYSADDETVAKARSIQEDAGIDIEVLPPTSHKEFVKLLGRAKLSIGLNISDGTPNTMLESMMMGAFPIQSDTISTREWITDGVNGLLVDPDDPDDLAKAIRRSIDDTDLLESAASANTAEIGEKLQREEVSKKVVHIYRAVLEDEI
jgi:hypothetical protein